MKGFLRKVLELTRAECTFSSSLEHRNRKFVSWQTEVEDPRLVRFGLKRRVSPNVVGVATTLPGCEEEAVDNAGVWVTARFRGRGMGRLVRRAQGHKRGALSVTLDTADVASWDQPRLPRGERLHGRPLSLIE
ncbi:hypothetical protein IscW_ISCW011200 [Ixodes scapularis]|uniref:Uncharacterized protein n=1 Tax=Ixodes scapularis TaxID=6945 RepID=B7Q532_IXOSC|nr:hypothetical protein IscW_ISCW011200 [Ixodes scapularis]|eukprot:XP_002411671.1 hypothetical protein IscW_ISCW011200 [Ixodes scapularis]